MLWTTNSIPSIPEVIAIKTIKAEIVVALIGLSLLLVRLLLRASACLFDQERGREPFRSHGMILGIALTAL